MLKRVWNFIVSFLKKASDDSVAAYAAQVAFFVMLSFFPFIMLMVMIASKLSFMNATVVGYILNVVPSGLESYVGFVIDDVVNSNIHSFTTITAIVSLWSAAKGIQALTNGLNKIYDVEKTRNFIIVRLMCAIYTLIFMLLCLVAIVLHAFGSQIAKDVIEEYPSLANATLLILSMKSVFTYVIIFVFLLLIYYQLPNRKGRVRHELSGAGLAALAWMFMTNAFSLYVKYAADNSKMYGSMTSLILLIIWLYVGMQIVLFGAEINYYMSGLIERSLEKRKLKQQQKLQQQKQQQEQQTYKQIEQ